MVPVAVKVAPKQMPCTVRCKYMIGKELKKKLAKVKAQKERVPKIKTLPLPICEMRLPNIKRPTTIRPALRPACASSTLKCSIAKSADETKI